MPEGHFTAEGIWVSAVLTVPQRGALFLDRDGVLVQEVHYLGRPQDVQMESGSPQLLGWAQANAIPTVVVTNQAGIARGKFDWPDFHAVEAEIVAQLARFDAKVDAVIAVPFHPEYTPSYGVRHDWWRKPGPGMFHLAAEQWGIPLERSWMVGDKESDIRAAKAAGLQGAVHVLSGHGLEHRAAALALATSDFPVFPVTDLTECLAILRLHALF